MVYQLDHPEKTHRKESNMYIGGGILGTILMVLLIVYLWRRV